jgi:hypothetical protein
MFVELFVNGELKRSWHFDNDAVPVALDEEISNERGKRWKDIVENCIVESGLSVPEYNRYEMCVRVRARVQPGDFSDVDMKKFETQIKTKRALHDLQKRVKK